MGILVPHSAGLSFSPTVSDNFRALTLPTGVSINGTVQADYARRRFRGLLVGWPSVPLIVLGDESVHIAGIEAPTVVPAMAASAGTGITGNAIGYLTFIHKIGDEIIAESDLSAPSATVALTNDGRDWTGLPATAPNPRVTHISGLVSMDGALPRRAWIRELGTTSVTENVPTASLGNAPPVDASGDLTNARGVPPYTRYVVKYKRRMWYLGDPAHPDRMWYSEIDEFESVGPNNYIETDDGEAITGGRVVGNQLIIGCLTAIYEVRGYRSSDFVLRKIHPTLGMLSHFAARVINTNGNDVLWFASQAGYVTYDGSFKFVFEDFRGFWKDDLAAETLAYSKMLAIEDVEYGVLKALIYHSAATQKSQYFVGHYTRWHEDPALGVSQPDWTRDLRDRVDTAMGLLADGTGRRVLYTGSDDGIIRKENVATNVDDDADTFLKRFRLRTFFNMMGEPGGGITDGRVWKQVWLYLRSELVAWVPKFFTGDPDAGDSTTATRSPGSQAASAGVDPSANPLEPKSAHPFTVDRAGRGICAEITIDSPRGIYYRGWGGTVSPGQAESRGIS